MAAHRRGRAALPEDSTSVSGVSDMGAPLVGVAEPSALDEAVAVLGSGGTVVLPTDTVYGVAALPRNLELPTTVGDFPAVEHLPHDFDGLT